VCRPEPAVELVAGLLAGEHLEPDDFTLAAVGLAYGAVEDVLGGAPDVAAGAVALDEGMMGRSAR